MKATGIVRRVDELGRLVIPKEIRRTLRIREGDPLEIFTDREGEIILKKYSPVGELGLFAKQYAEALAQTSGYTVLVTDRDQIVAVAGASKKELMAKPISRGLEKVIDARENILASSTDKNFVNISIDDDLEAKAQVIAPIICEGDAIGSVIMITKENAVKFGDTERKLCHSAAGFLGKQMES